ncbi:peptidyl-prolyl cis-trans isomerase [uncultured Hyphomonas sp.]|uniref:peptidyl-prolyl cis-trans isomerase n=1 Tax=uncultured Hyphomonas sp. TaxID=225298 RepID=UPI002AAA8383|nr:peptidyl-prolyl cis-trans isomerase [uncultured Hyphomonas sp.]
MLFLVSLSLIQLLRTITKVPRQMTEDVPGPRSSRTRLGRLLRQPFLHFLFGALAIFLLDFATSGRASAKQDAIWVSEPEISRLRAEWARSWARSPTNEELDTLISIWLEDEVYFRQAKAMGLDEDDPVIRQYLSSKMRFLTSDAIVVSDPRPEELATYFETYKAEFSADPLYSFEQVRIEIGDADAIQALLASLNAGEPARGGDGERIVAASRLDVSRKFGVTFYEKLADLPAGKWSGPVASSVGVHLIRVNDKDTPALPEFKEVEAAVRVAWMAEKRKELERAAFERLRAQFDIRVDDIKS